MFPQIYDGASFVIPHVVLVAPSQIKIEVVQQITAKINIGLML